MRWLITLVVLSSCTRAGARQAMYAGGGGIAIGGLIIVGGETEVLVQKSSAAPDGRIVLYPIAAALIGVGLALLIGGAVYYESPREDPPPDQPGSTAPAAGPDEILNARASEAAEAGDCTTVHAIKSQLAAHRAELVMTPAIERCLPQR